LESIFGNSQTQAIEGVYLRFQDACGDFTPIQFSAGGDAAKTADNDKGGILFEHQGRSYEAIVLNGFQQIIDICPGGYAICIILQVYPSQRYGLAMS
jgi:hypothetical protein